MTMIRNASSLVLVLMGAVRAQDEATTLARLCARAEQIAIVRPLSVGAIAEEMRTVRFHVVRSLKGAGTTTVAFSEPAMRGCGRALFGVVPGLACLAFWVVDDSGPRLVASSARALMTLEPDLVAHVEVLIAAQSKGQLVDALAAGLTAISSRVRIDAAWALAQSSELTQLATAGRTQCALALTNGLPTRSAEVPALLTVARRLQLDATIPSLVHAVLTEQRNDWVQLIAATAADVDASAAASELTARGTRTAGERERALTLLGLLPIEEAKPALRALLAAPEHRHVVQAAALLMRLGVTTVDLAPLVDAEVLDEARQPPIERPRFRSIHPEQTR